MNDKARMSALIWILCASSLVSAAPEISRQGRLFLHVGAHRAAFLASDIHLSGEGFDLELEDVSAHDLPAIDSLAFQYNLRIGYYLTEHFSLSLSFHHMKYQIDAPQTVRVRGFVNPSASENFAGRYENTVARIGGATDLVGNIEHTDGLGYFGIEAGYTHDFFSSGAWLRVSGIGFVSAGPLLVRTDWVALGKRHREDYRIGGFGLGAQAGLRIEIFRYFAIDTLFGGGFARVIDAIDDGRLRQDIGYFSGVLMFGPQIPLR